eukprot:138378_1
MDLDLAEILNVTACIVFAGPILIYLRFLYIDRYKWRSIKPSIVILVYTVMVDTILHIHACYIIAIVIPLATLVKAFCLIAYLMLTMLFVIILLGSNDTGSSAAFAIESLTLHCNIFIILCLHCYERRLKFMKRSFYNRYYYFIHQRRLLYDLKVSTSAFRFFKFIVWEICTVIAHAFWLYYYALLFMANMWTYHLIIGLIIQKWIVIAIYMTGFVHPKFDAKKEYRRSRIYILGQHGLPLDLLDVVFSYLPHMDEMDFDGVRIGSNENGSAFLLNNQ